MSRTITRSEPIAPIVEIDAPAADENVGYAQTTYEVFGTAADEDGSIDRVEYRIDGGEWQLANGTSSWSFTASDLPVGTTRIEVRAVDSDGFAAAITSRTITRNDAMAPALAIDMPAADAKVAYAVTTYEFSGMATDADGSIARVEVRIAGGAWQLADGTTDWSFTATDLQVGATLIEVRATDSDGFESEIVSRTITRSEAQLPVVAIDSPATDQSVWYPTTSIAFAGTASDADGSVARVEVRVRGGAWTAASGTTSWTFMAGELEVGANLVEVRGLDDDGFASLTVSRTITRKAAARFTLNVVSEGPGSVTLEPQAAAFDSGTVVTITATPGPGATFEGWSGDASGSQNPLQIVMDANKTVTAAFRGIPIALMQVVNGTASNATSVRSTTLAAANGHLYLATISTTLPPSDQGQPAIGVASVSGLGLTWTLVQEQCSGIEGTLTSVWRGLGTPTSNGTVTALLTAKADEAVINVARYSGVSASAPLGAVVSANNDASGRCSTANTSSSYAIGMPASTEGAVVFAGVAIRDRQHSPGAGFTELSEIHSGNSRTAGLAVQHMTTALPGAVIVAGSLNASSDWAVVAVEIRPLWADAPGAPIVLKTETVRAAGFAMGAQPNPFNPATRIQYTLPAAGVVDLSIYDVSGRFVTNLVRGHRAAGSHTEEWRATSSTGGTLASGVYVARITSGAYSATVKLLLVR
jgi:hypothetical protein